MLPLEFDKSGSQNVGNVISIDVGDLTNKVSIDEIQGLKTG